MSISLLLQWAQTTSFRLVVENIYTAELLAFIAVGMAVSASIFAAVESLATQFYMPIYLRQITHADQIARTKAWNRLAAVMLPIYTSVAVFVIINAEHLLRVLVAEKFHSAVVYTMLGAFIEFLRVATNLVYLVSQSEVRTRETVFPYLMGLILMLLGFSTIDSSVRLWVVPVIIASANLIVLFLMFRYMKKLLVIKLNPRAVLQPLVLMAPLAVTLYIDLGYGFFDAVLMLLLSGIYLLLIQFKLLRSDIRAIVGR